jgi:hypothetical protein
MNDFYGGDNLLFHNTSAAGFNIISPQLFNIYRGGEEQKGGNKNNETAETNFIIPVGLIKFNKEIIKSTNNITKEAKILSDDIYDKLLELVDINNKPTSKNTSKKNRKKSNNTSKKRK